MADVSPVDYTSEVGRVRKYIPDVRQLDGEYIFTDAEITSFIEDETADGALEITSFRLRRAAAYAMIAIANDENLILKKIKTEDLETDGPAVAAALLKSAQELFRRASVDEEAVIYEEVFYAVPNPFAPAPPPFTLAGGYWPGQFVGLP